MDRYHVALVLTRHFLTYFCISLAVTLGVLVCLELRRNERRARQSEIAKSDIDLT